MSITIPTIDLGALGATFEEEYREDGESAVEPGAPPEGIAAGDPVVATGESAAAAAPAAEAGAEPVADDAEVAYQARFEADYAERSKADIRQLQSALDKRYAALAKRESAASEDLRETRDYAEFLEAKLAEYDPDEVARFRENRRGHRDGLARQRQRRDSDLERRRAFRAAEFPKLYPGVDPDEPELVAAFERGDADLEVALIRERLLALQLAEARRPAPKAAPAAPPAAAKAAPARDEGGRFVARAEATRALEQARGSDGMGIGRQGGFPDKPPSSLADARAIMRREFARLGVQ